MGYQRKSPIFRWGFFSGWQNATGLNPQRFGLQSQAPGQHSGGQQGPPARRQ